MNGIISRNFKIEDITFVVIGRNEAKNLGRCFTSIQKVSSKIIYVDSNSRDESIKVAQEYKIPKIVQLNSSHYSPALGRVVGADLVTTKIIQFIDGDQALAEGWPQLSINFLNKNTNAAIVHGYKKEYKVNYEDFTIKSDKSDHQSDYLQGSCCVVRDVYNRAGGFDYRFIGQEERDLYVSIHHLGYEVWYHHELMSSHYDFKSRGIKYLFFTDISVMSLVFLIKSIINKKILSYFYVYRRLNVFLLVEILSIILLFSGLLSGHTPSFIFLFLIQSSALIYAKLISRVGYFIIWKAVLLNIHRLPRVLNNKVQYEVKIIG
jgi:hypothetical protein